MIVPPQSKKDTQRIGNHVPMAPNSMNSIGMSKDHVEANQCFHFQLHMMTTMMMMTMMMMTMKNDDGGGGAGNGAGDGGGDGDGGGGGGDGGSAATHFPRALGHKTKLGWPQIPC